MQVDRQTMQTMQTTGSQIIEKAGKGAGGGGEAKFARQSSTEQW